MWRPATHEILRPRLPGFRLATWQGVYPAKQQSGVDSRSLCHGCVVSCLHAKLLLYRQNRVLRGLGDAKFDDGLGWNLDLLLRLWIKAYARFSLLLHQLAKTGHDKFAVLFNLFVGKRAERIEEYSSGSFIGLGGFG
jgi:hypothetical protein